MKYTFTFLAAIITMFTAAAQNLAVYGIVKSTETKEPLSYCTISVLNTRRVTSTDGNGKFRIIIPAPSSTPKIVVSYTGYRTDTLTIGSTNPGLIVFLQPLPGALSEVVITGVSRATLIRENPVAISNVSSKNIDIAIESNIVDALVKNVPGLNAVKTGPNISKPFIRGLGYNRVLTLYDGIRQEGQQWGDEHGIEVDAYNIDKAEVIKGPASLMFGSDAVAGVVSMFPYLPKEKDDKIHGRVLSEYQSNNGLSGNGFRLGYNNGHWLWAVRGSYRVAKNYTNKVDDRVYNTGFKETNATITVGYSSSKGYTNLNATLYNNLQGIPDGSRDSATRKFTKQIYEGALDDITNRPVVPEAELNSYSLSPLHQHIQHYRLYSNSHYQLANGEIDAAIGFQQNIRREYSHPTAPGQAGLFVQLNTINYGLKYVVPAFSNIEITIGANGMYQNNSSKDATDLPIPDYHLLDIGTYLYGKWKYNKLTVSGGIRYDIRQLKGNDLYVGTNAVTGFGKQVFVPDTAGASLQFPSFKKNFTGISLSIGAAYQLSDIISLKANIARGYRSPNITEFASNGLDPGAHIIYLGNRNFVPEFSFQQDLGLIANCKNISASVSIFNNTVQNYIYLVQLADPQGNAVVDAQGNKTFQYQQGTARLYGAEASFDIHPGTWQGFNFSNNVSLTYGINKNVEFSNKKTGGEYLPLIPPLKWLSGLSKEIKTVSKLFSSFTVKAELEYNARQNRFLALFNTETYTPAYSLINISARTQINYTKKNTLQLQFQVNNICDVACQSHLSRLKYFEYYSASPGGHLGMYNAGRNICVKLIAGF
jgi:iron complex outermembrane receptor protein